MRAERARKKNIKSLKTTFGPPLLPIKYPHKTPPVTNLREGGGGGSGPPVSPPPSESAHEYCNTFIWCVNPSVRLYFCFILWRRFIIALQTFYMKKTYKVELSLLVFYVTCNDISVIYVTAHMCRRTEEEVVPMVGLPMPKTFRRVL